MCANHYLGPESHSVHTMKSTKIVVEENSTCNDVEVDDLLKRARQQRASLAEILTEKSIEKCDTQPEGTLKSPTSSFFITCIPSTQFSPHTPKTGMKVIEIFIIYLFDSKLFSLSLIIIFLSAKFSFQLLSDFLHNLIWYSHRLHNIDFFSPLFTEKFGKN